MLAFKYSTALSVAASGSCFKTTYLPSQRHRNKRDRITQSAYYAVLSGCCQGAVRPTRTERLSS